MFGWMKPFFTSSEIKLGQYVPPRQDGTLSCVLLKRLLGQWSPRLAELTPTDELRLFKSEKEEAESKVYNLRNIKKLLLGAGQNSIHAKMTFKNGEKLYLKITGPQGSEWGKRISQCKFPTKEMPKSEKKPTFDGEPTTEEEEETDATGEDSDVKSEISERSSDGGYSTPSTLPMDDTMNMGDIQMSDTQMSESQMGDTQISDTQMSYSRETIISLDPSTAVSRLPSVAPPPPSPFYIPASDYSASIGEEDTTIEMHPSTPTPQPRIPRRAALPSRLPVQVPVDDEPSDFSLVTRMGRVFEKNYLSRKDSHRQQAQ